MRAVTKLACCGLVALMAQTSPAEVATAAASTVDVGWSGAPKAWMKVTRTPGATYRVCLMRSGKWRGRSGDVYSRRVRRTCAQLAPASAYPLLPFESRFATEPPSSLSPDGRCQSAERGCNPETDEETAGQSCVYDNSDGANYACHADEYARMVRCFRADLLWYPGRDGRGVCLRREQLRPAGWTGPTRTWLEVTRTPDVRHRVCVMRSGSSRDASGHIQALKQRRACTALPRLDPPASSDARWCNITQPRSTGVGTATSIEFVNRTAEKVEVWWLNYQGRPVYYTSLAPGQSYLQQTLLTHPWLITNRAGNCVGYTVSDQAAKTYVIDPSSAS